MSLKCWLFFVKFPKVVCYLFAMTHLAFSALFIQSFICEI
jgi:hypothetical protein